MNRRLNRIGLAAALAIPLSGGIASSASAETVVMGSPLTNEVEAFAIAAPTVTAQISFDPATSPNPVVSPANGVITGWKVRSNDDDALYTLKVLRANGPVTLTAMVDSNFTSIASVQAPAPVPAGTGVASPTGAIFDYPASLPIAKGDYIGLLASGAVATVPQNTTDGLSQNLIANNFAGQPADGSAANLLADQQHDLLLQATIRYCKVPAVVGQAEAAATAAIAAAECTSKVTREEFRLRAIKKSFSKKKKKRIRAANAALQAQDGKVISQGTPADTTVVPGEAVALRVAQVVAPPKKKKKTTKKH